MSILLIISCIIAYLILGIVSVVVMSHLIKEEPDEDALLMVFFWPVMWIGFIVIEVIYLINGLCYKKPSQKCENSTDEKGS